MGTCLLTVEVCVWGFLAWLGGLGMQVGVAGVAWVLAGCWGRGGPGRPRIVLHLRPSWTRALVLTTGTQEPGDPSGAQYGFVVPRL